jgi:hypothetical protein
MCKFVYSSSNIHINKIIFPKIWENGISEEFGLLEARRNTSLNLQMVGFITARYPLMSETLFVMPIWNGPTVTALTGNQPAI